MTTSKWRCDERKCEDMTMIWDFFVNIIYKVIINFDNAKSRDLWRYWDNLLTTLLNEAIHCGLKLWYYVVHENDRLDRNMVNLKHNFFGYVYCWATACNDGEICKAYLNDCISTHNVYKMTGTSVINAAIRQVLVFKKMGKLLILTKAWKSIRNAKVMHVHEKQLEKWKKVERQIWGLNSCWKLY